MKRFFVLLTALALTAAFSAYGQKAVSRKTTVQKTEESSALTNVHLFQSFFRDAPVAQKAFGQGAFSYANYKNFSDLQIGAMGGVPINEKIDVQGELYYESQSFDEIHGVKIDGESGLTDLGLYGRYNFKKDKKQIMSAGAMITLPIGSDKLGYGSFDFGVFGAFRTLLNKGVVIAANAGLDFVEVPKSADAVDFDDFEFAKASMALASSGSGDTERQTRFRLGGGVIYPLNKQVHLVGELALISKVDYMMLSGGVDYALKNGGRLRGALGLGLDDGAPDFQIMAGYLINLK